MSKLAGIAAAAALALGLAGQAQATTFFNGSVGDWQTAGSLTDSDGDSVWGFVASTLPTTGLTINLTEQEIGNIDYYAAKFTFDPSVTNATYNLTYTIKINPGSPQEVFTLAALDSDVTNVTSTIRKTLTDANGNDILTLVSTDGAHVTGGIGGEYLTVNETFTVNNTGYLNSVSNNYTVQDVPEPATVLLVGLGVLGAATSRRRTRG